MSYRTKPAENIQYYKICLALIGVNLLLPVISGMLISSSLMKPIVIFDILFVIYLSVQTDSFRKTFFSFPVMIWGVLMGYHFVNAFIISVPDTNIDRLLQLAIQPTIILGTSIFVAKTNYKHSVKIIFLFFLLLLICVWLFDNRVTLDEENRLSTDLFYATQLGQIASFACLLASIYAVYKNKTFLFFLLLIIIPLTITLQTGSRNGLAICLVAFISFFVGKNLSKFKVSIVISLFSFFILIWGVGGYVVKETTSGQRFLGALKGDEMQVADDYATGTFWDILIGERVTYYVVGFDNFQDSPLTGIGLLNYLNFNKTSDFIMHSEYMTHLTEGGIFGFSLYLAFICYVIRLFIKNKFIMRYDTVTRKIYIQSLIFFLSFIYLGVTARIYDRFQFFVLYGIIIGFLQVIEYKSIKKKRFLLNHKQKVSDSQTTR